MDGWAGALRAHVGAWEGWKRCAGGWYPEGVRAVGGCGERDHLMGVVGSEGPRRGESGGGPGSGDLGACGGLEGSGNSRDVTRVSDQSRKVDRHSRTSALEVTVSLCRG